MFIIIIKTSIHGGDQAVKLKEILDTGYRIQSWSIDLDDCDKVLRVVAMADISPALLFALRQSGIACATMGVFNAKPPVSTI
jgi:hypothetical protein